MAVEQNKGYMNYAVQSIQELLQQASPLTGAVSLDPFSTLNSSSFLLRTPSHQNPSSASTSRPESPQKKRKRSHADKLDTNPGTQWKTLKPLKHPTIIIGTIHLWNSNLHFQACTLKADCLAFTDHTATICCAVLDLDPHVIGHQLLALSWNFIPAKTGSGYLEISKWTLANENAELQKHNFPSLYLSPTAAQTRNYMLETPPCKNRVHSSRTTICSRLYAMSPPFVLPCKKPDINTKRNNVANNRKDGHSRIDTMSDNVAKVINFVKNGKDMAVKNDAVSAVSRIPDFRRKLFGKTDENIFSSDLPEYNCSLFQKSFKDEYVKSLDEKPRVSSVENHNSEDNVIKCNKRSRVSMGGDDSEAVNACNTGTDSKVLDERDNSNGEPSSPHKKARVLRAEEENKEESVLGFLVELRPCNHKVVCKASSEDLLYKHAVREKQHVCVNPEFVYFTGSVAAWRPALSSLMGKCLTITGLKRKLMVVGEEKEEYNAFVATTSSILSLVCSENSSAGSNNESYREHYQLQGHDTYRINRGFQTNLACNMSKTIADMNNGRATIRRNDDILISGKNGAPPSFSVTPSLLTGKLNKQRQSRTGSYVGTVTGIYMQGLVIELDRNVWLLLTHQPLAQIHGLRIGALLVLRHVHFIKIEFTWEKILLLGACFKSHIAVKSFSPLRTPFNARPYAGSILSRFIECLSFTAGFWVLLVTACFRHKFHGIFSEKEILGSKNCEGMVQKYVRSQCCSFHSSHRDLLKEFFNHDCSCPVGEPAGTVLQLIAPINNFCRQIESMWVDRSSVIWKIKRDKLTKDARELTCAVEEHAIKKARGMEELGANKEASGHFVRRIISNKDLGVVLVGILQASQESGRLQLVDATGAVDVVVPDLALHSSVEHFYEVTDFSVVVEGFCGLCCSLDTMDCVQPLSCARVIDGFVSKRKLSSVTYYVHFYLKKAISFNVPRWPVANLNKTIDIERQEVQERRIFWIILVTHKYVIKGKLGVDKSDWNAHNSFAEAVVLPYSIVTEDRKPSGHNRSPVKDETGKKLEHDIFTDIDTNYSFEESTCSNTRGDMVDTKRFDNTSVKCMCSISTPNSCDGDGIHDHPSSYFHKEQTISEKCSDRLSEEERRKLQCSLHFRNLYTEDVLLHGKLFMLINCLESKVLSEENPCLKKVLLEFGCQSLSYYQLLQIGDCYLIQCQAEDCSSDPLMAFPSLKTDKITVSSHNPIWSLAIASYHWIGKQIGHQNSILSVNDYNTPPLTLLFYDMNEPTTIINNGKKGRSSTGWHGQTPSVNLRDVILYIPCGAVVIIQELIEHVKANMIPIIRGVYDAFEKCLACRVMVDAPPQFSNVMVYDNGAKFEGKLPEGELISLHGEVKDVLCKELNPFLKENRFSCKYLPTDISSIFIPKVMYTIHLQGPHGSEKICLRGILNKCVLPLGFGPGVSASFYRVLLQSDPTGEQELLLTPASTIVVKATKEVLYHVDGRYNTEAQDRLLIPNDWHIKDSILISCLSNSLIEEGIKLCCRVVSVQSLVLQWQPRKSEPACSLVGGALNSIQIITGSFILDDGSGLCDCWATGVRAAHLLSIYSTAGEIFDHLGSLCKVSKRATKKPKNTVGFFLEKMAKKHQQITIQKNNSVSSLHAKFTMQGVSKEILNPEEQTLISFVLKKACDSGPLVIIGSSLSSPDQRTGEQNMLDKIEITGDQENFSTLTECRRKILARHVSALNFLQEAGNIFEELASEI